MKIQWWKISIGLTTQLPSRIEDDDFRIRVGEGEIPGISVLNISGTSFGSISPKAIQSFSAGAKKVLLIIRVRVLYLNITNKVEAIQFGRYQQATSVVKINMVHSMKFNLRKAKLEQVKMIEIKLSQGAKPGHGGMLLGAKVSPEIAEARNVPVFEDVISPHKHSGVFYNCRIINLCR